MASCMDLITNTAEGVADGADETDSLHWLQLLIQAFWVGRLPQRH